jgi:GDP-mannose 6-dehydrogenase
MNISIIGIGYVGVVSAACLADFGHTVIGVDISADKVARFQRGDSPIVEPDVDRLIAEAVKKGRLLATLDVREAVHNSDVSFISVGTPSAPNGSVSLTAVDHVISQIGAAIADKKEAHIVVMRSTVPPGTAEERVLPALEATSCRKLGDRLHYYSNPEFLREGTAVKDFIAPPYTLIGAPADDDASALRELYGFVEAPIRVVPYRVAEAVKYLSNAYHAVKLAFANEAGAILSEYGVDAPEAFKLFSEDRILNISPAYLRPGFAFGGSCLPKDVRSFMSLAVSKDVPSPLLSSVLPSNTAIVERAYNAIARLGRQRVSLFGLAFKRGTDDLRESPFVLLAERLIGKGYELSIFDRSVNVASLMGSNKDYIEREIPHLERLMANDPKSALKDSCLAVVGHIGEDDLSLLLPSLSGHTVIDLAGISALRTRKGISYQGLCW